MMPSGTSTASITGPPSLGNPAALRRAYSSGVPSGNGPPSRQVEKPSARGPPPAQRNPGPARVSRFARHDVGLSRGARSPLPLSPRTLRRQPEHRDTRGTHLPTTVDAPELYPDILVPERRVLADELPHQFNAALI